MPVLQDADGRQPGERVTPPLEHGGRRQDDDPPEPKPADPGDDAPASDEGPDGDDRWVPAQR